MRHRLPLRSSVRAARRSATRWRPPRSRAVAPAARHRPRPGATAPPPPEARDRRSGRSSRRRRWRQRPAPAPGSRAREERSSITSSAALGPEPSAPAAWRAAAARSAHSVRLITAPLWLAIASTSARAMSRRLSCLGAASRPDHTQRRMVSGWGLGMAPRERRRAPYIDHVFRSRALVASSHAQKLLQRLDCDVVDGAMPSTRPRSGSGSPQRVGISAWYGRPVIGSRPVSGGARRRIGPGRQTPKSGRSARIHDPQLAIAVYSAITAGFFIYLRLCR